MVYFVYLTECQLEKVPGDITSFKMKNHWAKMKCADATRFDENKCTCVPHVFSAVRKYKCTCVPHVFNSVCKFI